MSYPGLCFECAKRTGASVSVAGIVVTFAAQVVPVLLALALSKDPHYAQAAGFVGFGLALLVHSFIDPVLRRYQFGLRSGRDIVQSVQVFVWALPVSFYLMLSGAFDLSFGVLL